MQYGCCAVARARMLRVRKFETECCTSLARNTVYDEQRILDTIPLFIVWRLFVQQNSISPQHFGAVVVAVVLRWYPR